MKFKRTLAIILSIVLIICGSPLVTIAEDTAKSNETSIDISSTEISLSGTTSVGNMLAAELNEVAEQNEGSGNVIYSAEIELNSAFVEFSTAVSCTLFVGIYTEDSNTLLTSGYTEITPEDENAFITLDNTPPAYFFVKAYLVDTEDFSPLSAVYDNAMYTQEMQEFLSKTTDDFEEEKVVNFDEDTANNFAVLSDEVIILNEKSETNKVILADNVSQIYMFENIDETISSLNVDDTFTFDYNGETVIVKVGEIAIEGTNATIWGAEAELTDFFDYVRIDDNTGITEDTVDASSCSEGITFEGYTEPPATYVSRAIDIEETIKRGAIFNVNFWEEETDNEVASASLTGSIELSATFSPKLYISLSYKQIELKFDYELSGTLTASGKIECEIPIAFFTFGITGIRAEITPDFVFSVGGSVSVKGTYIKGTVGYGWNSNSGGQNLCSTPKQDLEFKAEVAIFIGLRIDPKIKILEGALAEATLESNLGIEVTASLSDSVEEHFDTSKKHDCEICVSGEIYGKFDLKVSGELLNCDKLSLEFTLLEVKLKIKNFYWSLTYNEFKFTTCPHMSYKLDVMVSDFNGLALSGAVVSVNGSSYTTSRNGLVSVYLPNGEYKITAVKNDSLKSEARACIKDNSESLNITIKPNDSSSPDIDINYSKKCMSLGFHHSASVTEDGDLYLWGSNSYGVLGDGTDTDSYTPKKIMSNVKSVSLGYYRSAAITNDGDLYLWGWNSDGQIGDGTDTDSYTPKKIMNNVKTVSLGDYHSAAITNDGELYVWGSNSKGQLGDGTITNNYTPKKIMDDVAEVSLGASHSAAVTNSGELYVWGSNSNSQIGDGTDTDSYTPKKIMSNVKTVSLGDHSAAITNDGDLYLWGENCYGQIGDGTDENSYTPKKIMSDVTMVSLGGYHSAAITNSGDLYLWGMNYEYQIGDGIGADIYTPKKIMSDVTMVSLGFLHSGAITNSGELYMWGDNLFGAIGDGTSWNNVRTPKKITLPNEAALSTTLYNSVSLSETLEQKSFENLEPNTIYNFYIMKDKSSENALDPQNLLYVNQSTTDENGNISFKYVNTDDDFENAEKFVVKYKNVLPESSISDIIVTASPQKVFLSVNENNLLDNEYKNIKAKLTVNNEDIVISDFSTENGKMLFEIDLPANLAVNSVISVCLLAEYKGEIYECKDCYITLGDARTDVDSNGDVNLQDVSLSAQHLAGWNVSLNEKMLDISGDNLINLKDLVTLARYVAGWDVELNKNS